MNTRTLTVLALLAFFAAIALGHGSKKHLIGTIDRINAESVIVKTTDGKSVEVKLTPSTAYVLRSGNQDKPAKVSELEVGDRVVIHATPSGETFSADEIKFSPAPTNPGTPRTKPKP